MPYSSQNSLKPLLENGGPLSHLTDLLTPKVANYLLSCLTMCSLSVLMPIFL